MSNKNRSQESYLIGLNGIFLIPEGLIITDADNKQVYQVRSTTSYNENTTGYFVNSYPETDNLRISSKDYFDSRKQILNCGTGAFLLATLLSQSDNQEAQSMLSLASNLNAEEFSDSSIEYLKRYLPIASLQEYINRLGEQTVFLHEAAKAGKKGVIATDSILYLWLTDEKQNFPQAPMDRERYLMSHVLQGFEKGSHHDKEWRSANQDAIRYYSISIKTLHRNYTGRNKTIDDDSQNLLHNIISIPIPDNLTNPWNDSAN
jgi:hypothetical protein